MYQSTDSTSYFICCIFDSIFCVFDLRSPDWIADYSPFCFFSGIYEFSYFDFCDKYSESGLVSLDSEVSCFFKSGFATIDFYSSLNYYHAAVTNNSWSGNACVYSLYYESNASFVISAYFYKDLTASSASAIFRFFKLHWYSLQTTFSYSSRIFSNFWNFAYRSAPFYCSKNDVSWLLKNLRLSFFNYNLKFSANSFGWT